MTNKDLQYNLERVQTKIEMIRQESRVLSYKIDRMMEQRKELQAEKRQLKDLVESYNV
jgi:predicted RNase H-like nuclease (RuvC/YqgF family)